MDESREEVNPEAVRKLDFTPARNFANVWKMAENGRTDCCWKSNCYSYTGLYVPIKNTI